MCRGLLPPVQSLAVGTTVPPGELLFVPKDGTEGIVDDTGNSDTYANRCSDLLDDKRRFIRCRRHSCSDIACIEREFRFLDFVGASFILALPIAWWMAPRLRARYWRPGIAASNSR